MVYDLLRALPGDQAFLTPSLARITPRKLDANLEASGPHDFAVRIQRCSSTAPSTSTASRSASVTIASRPFWKERDHLSLIRKSELVKFYSVIQNDRDNPGNTGRGLVTLEKRQHRTRKGCNFEPKKIRFPSISQGITCSGRKLRRSPPLLIWTGSADSIDEDPAEIPILGGRRMFAQGKALAIGMSARTSASRTSVSRTSASRTWA
jgi:hypothetical protein